MTTSTKQNPGSELLVSYVQDTPEPPPDNDGVGAIDNLSDLDVVVQERDDFPRGPPQPDTPSATRNVEAKAATNLMRCRSGAATRGHPGNARGAHVRSTKETPARGAYEGKQTVALDNRTSGRWSMLAVVHQHQAARCEGVQTM
jgi:hypothetical protein